MELSHVREFLVLSEKRSFLDAAKDLFISQSTLSKHMKKLEQEIGNLLFVRTTRSVMLSKAGELFLPYAHQLVKVQEEWERALAKQEYQQTQTVRIGSIPALAQYNITGLLARYKKQHPDTVFQIYQSGSDQLKEMLHQDICELAFVRETDIPEDEFCRIPYMSDSMAVILPVNHPLAGMTQIPLQQLKSEDFILLEQGTMLHRISVEACRESGFEPNVVFTDHKLENILDMVIKEMGVALLMKKLVLYPEHKQLAVLDIAPSITTHVSVCYRRGKPLSHAAKQFLGSLQIGSK